MHTKDRILNTYYYVIRVRSGLGKEIVTKIANPMRHIHQDNSQFNLEYTLPKTNYRCNSLSRHKPAIECINFENTVVSILWESSGNKALHPQSSYGSIEI